MEKIVTKEAKYPGYAFTEGWEDKAKKISGRYNELALSSDDIDMRKTPSYGKGEFRGRLLSDKAKELSAMDVLTYADNGNLCFGGNCRINSDNTFSGYYFTD